MVRPSTLATVFNMGGVAEESGDQTTAKALYARAAEGRAKSLGPAHPKTVQAQKAVQKCG